MSRNKWLITGFLILIFVTAFIQYRNAQPEKKVVTVAMVFSKQTVVVDGKKSQSLLRIKKGSTALQLLAQTHKVVTKGEKENAFVTTIDGKMAISENREFWAFYVNGKQAQVGAGSYIIKNNDTIEWKIETY